jgi:chemotaxis protein CheC
MQDTFSEAEKDQIKEIVNIGAGNASTALSHMVGKRIDMSVPQVFYGTLEEVHSKFKNSDELAASVLLKLESGLQGAMLMIFENESAIHLVKLLSKKEFTSISEFKEGEISALTEVGNILLGASISALGRFLHIDILHSIPDVSIDMLGASLQEALVELSVDENILLFNVNLNVENGFVGNLFFFFDGNSTKTILDYTKKMS